MERFDPRNVLCTNHKTGETKEFTLRPFCCGDEKAVLQCVLEEYGDSYYRREYYDSSLLVSLIDEGRLFLFLAFCGDDVCGIQSLVSHAPKETRLEAASQIFRKAYRGYGLPYELVKYTYEIAVSLQPSCIYASMVVYHYITQTMCTEAGMCAVAFNLGSHITSKMHNSFMLGKSEKYAQAIMILPVAKADVGTVYIHPEIADVAKARYEKLGVSYSIVTSVPDKPDDAFEGNTSITVSVNEREQSVTAVVDVIGPDLAGAVRKIMDEHTGKYWTIQLILPVDDKCAIHAYEQLRTLGFFFTGVRPLCSSHEQIFMQYIGDVHFNYEDFRLTEDFRALLEDILKHG